MQRRNFLKVLGLGSAIAATPAIAITAANKLEQQSKDVEPEPVPVPEPDPMPEPEPKHWTEGTFEELEAHMQRVFMPMEHAVSEIRDRSALDGFGMGYEMHDTAKAAAPAWLSRWDDDRRWCICFTQGWKGLVIMAKAFGWTKERLLLDLAHYAKVA